MSAIPTLENIVIFLVIGCVLSYGGTAWILLLLLFVNMRSNENK